MNDKAFSDYCTKILKDSSVCSETFIFHDLIFKEEFRELLKVVGNIIDSLSMAESAEWLKEFYEKKLEEFREFLGQSSLKAG